LLNTKAKWNVRCLEKTDPETSEKYIALTLSGAGLLIDLKRCQGRPGLQYSNEIPNIENDAVEILNFIPYYFRANRNGNGQMRVGIRHI
jgi:hypothetical protein